MKITNVEPILVSAGPGKRNYTFVVVDTDEGISGVGESGLSSRELEILTLISAGCSAADIADVLDISPHTVTNYKRRIFQKLGVHSRTQAAAEAGRLGLRGEEADPRLLELDPTSYLATNRNWRPTLPRRDGPTGEFTMVDLLTFARVDPTSRGQ